VIEGSAVPAWAHDISPEGLAFIARNEGCVLHPYDDGGPGKGNATIGVGHLIHLGPVTQADVQKYRGFTEADAMKLLHSDVAKVVEAVRALGVELTTGEFDALVDLGFNCGIGALEGGIAKGLRERNKALVTQTILEYDHVGHEVSPGLRARRQRDVKLFQTGTYS
jgi:lysozyme